nr:hypothetical protein HUO10_001840 [Paraburkholderia busanensis]
MHSLHFVPVHPISAEHPCGVDLEYDFAFIALQQAAMHGREQQFGDTLIPAVAPDWRQVAASAIELLGRTMDLRLFALLTRAWTELSGLEGYARGLTVTADALDQHWEHIHPQLHVAGDFDPLPRLNALAALTDREGAGRAARGATLLHWRLGELSLRDAAAILEGGLPSVANLDMSSGAALQAELQTALSGAHDALAFVSQALDALDRIARGISAHLNGTWVPDADCVEHPLRLVLQSAARFAWTNKAETALPQPPASITLAGAQTRLSPTSPTSPLAAASASHAAGHGTNLPTAANGNGNGNGNGLASSIHTRDDILRALDDICRYLDHAEPGHPAPLLLRRAQRLMHMNFHDLVRDMAPAGLPQLEALAGEPHRPSNLHGARPGAPDE